MIVCVVETLLSTCKRLLVRGWIASAVVYDNFVTSNCVLDYYIMQRDGMDVVESTSLRWFILS